MNKTALITGASGGIGAAVALALAGAGYQVALGCHTQEEKANELCRRINSQGMAAIVCPGNVGDSRQVDEMFTLTEKELGKVSVVVNNAGIAQQKLVCDISDEEWQQMMAVHASGTFYCCRRALPNMIQAKSGSIINIVSMWGQVGASCEVHYSAAKAAVIGLTKALAKEVAPCGIRVNAVSPGVVDTAMMQGFTPEDKAALCEEIPLGQMGTPEDVASTVLFLASGEARFVTGQVIGVNGGMVV